MKTFSNASLDSPMISGSGCSGWLNVRCSFLRKKAILSSPSVCGMFVYREDTSIEANRQCSGSFVFSIKSVWSLVCMTVVV